jgi:hypothetical protein
MCGAEDITSHSGYVMIRNHGALICQCELQLITGEGVSVSILSFMDNSPGKEIPMITLSGTSSNASYSPKDLKFAKKFKDEKSVTIKIEQLSLQTHAFLSYNSGGALIKCWAGYSLEKPAPTQHRDDVAMGGLKLYKN